MVTNDYGDTGAEWTARWRHIQLEYTAMSRLKLDTQLNVLKQHTLALDKEDSYRNLERLDEALTKLHRDAERYVLQAVALRNEVRRFADDLGAYIETWTPPEPPAYQWGTYTGADDEVIDRIARFYTDKGHHI